MSMSPAKARVRKGAIEMINSGLQRLFSPTTWRRWLETLQQLEEAMHISELDLLERRVRNLEAHVSDLRAQARKP
jgi:hypothetical protein